MYLDTLAIASFFGSGYRPQTVRKSEGKKEGEIGMEHRLHL